MAISSTTNRISYIANGVQTAFPFPYVYYDQSQLLVYANSTLQTLASHYTVSPTTGNPEDGGAGSSGGTVTFVTAPANLTVITIIRSLAITQGTVLNDGNNFPAKTIEKTLDQATMMLQQHDDSLTRSMKTPNTESSDMTLPAVATRKNMILGFGASGLPTAVAPSTVSGTSVTATGGSTGRFLADRFADWINVKDFGAVGDGTTDDTAAIQAAINYIAGNAVVLFPRGTYKITDTLTIGNDRMNLVGAGIGATKILMAPAAHDKIAFYFTRGASLQTGCSLRGFTVTSTDSTYRKTALKVDDQSNFRLDDFEVTGTTGSPAVGLWDSTNVSKGIHLRGRDMIRVRNVFVYADYPLYVDLNPNNSGAPRPLEDLDQANFHNCVFRPNTNARPAIVFVDHCAFAQVSFTGQQAWVGGTHGLYWVSTTSDSSCAGLTIENARYEQSAGTTAYAVYIDTNFGNGMQQVMLRNVYIGTTQRGFYFRKCLHVSLQNTFVTTSTLEQLNVDSTVGELELNNCFWQSGGTASITGQELVYAVPKRVAGAPLSQTARYVSAGSDKATLQINSAIAQPSFTLANFAVTNCVNNGSGLIRVTAVGHSFVTGGRVSVRSVGGTTEANGLWTITKIDADNFDLQGSTFANPYTSGGNASLVGQLGDNSTTGLLLVANDQNHQAIFSLRGASTATIEVSDPSTVFSAAAGTASSNNIVWDSGISKYIIENVRGATIVYRIALIGSYAHIT